MRKIFLWVSILAFLTGCTHLHKIDRTLSDTRLGEINNEIVSKKAKIVLKNGEIKSGRDIRITRDSTSWFDPDTKDIKTIPTEDIKKITVLRRGRGALYGAGLVALVGGTLTAIILSNPNNRESCTTPPAEPPPVDCLSTGFLLSTLTLNGMAYGAAIGAIIGSKDDYIFVAPGD